MHIHDFHTKSHDRDSDKCRIDCDVNKNSENYWSAPGSWALSVPMPNQELWESTSTRHAPDKAKKYFPLDLVHNHDALVYTQTVNQMLSESSHDIISHIHIHGF